ncbi:MAG: hypothetical protein KY457_12350 [Actinobacteria bacterium]|nr:hypothetical protein [Actinomycetota bacterium]
MSDRREVMRAINRGVALDDRPRAALAVGVARRQQRFWQRAWLIGPLVSLIFLGQGVTAFLANAAIAVLILGGMSLFWYRRAARAEQANLEVLGLRTGDPDAKAASATAAPPGDVPDRAGTPHAANPPKPPRRKRR